MADTLFTPEVKSFLKHFAISLSEKAAVAFGSFLVANNLLASSDAANFEHVAAGFLIALIGVASAWYREKGRALIEAQLASIHAGDLAKINVGAPAATAPAPPSAPLRDVSAPVAAPVSAPVVASLIARAMQSPALNDPDSGPHVLGHNVGQPRSPWSK